MTRTLILLLVAVGLALVIWPFVATSRALDLHGVPVTGHIHNKSETVGVLYSTWEQTREVTIEYPIIETRSVSFFTVHPETAVLDNLHTGQPIAVRYLLRRDVPDVPLAGALREIHLLPMVRVVGWQEASKLREALTPPVLRIVGVFACAAVLLLLWRIARWSALAWAAFAVVLAGFGLVFLRQAPSATPAPALDVRHASAAVKAVEHIDKIFSGAHQRGLVADQPVDVVGVEFMPNGRSEAVLAVDLIDRESLPGLKVGSTVAITYENASPRTAYIDGARRTFPQRNFSGAILVCAVGIAFVVGLWLLGQWIVRLMHWN